MHNHIICDIKSDSALSSLLHVKCHLTSQNDIETLQIKQFIMYLNTQIRINIAFIYMQEYCVASTFNNQGI